MFLDGYFNELDEKIMEIIRRHPDYQTSREELESVSPLLSSISKRPVYSVPKGYFENFKPGVEEKKRQRLCFNYRPEMAQVRRGSNYRWCDF